MTDIKKMIPSWLVNPLRRLRDLLLDPYAVKSYSQEGEDMVLQRIFSEKNQGFFVDVGAHHPRRFSNTCLFYRRGWHGINIEPNPESIALFRRERNRDVNLQMGVSDHLGSMKYYLFNDPALNSFDRDLANFRAASTHYKIVGHQDIPVDRLDNILKKYLPNGVKIDFLSIDAEGLDIKVLQSNDWSMFRPSCVLVESLKTSIESAMQGEIYRFMKSRGYRLFAKTYNTLFFVETTEGDEGKII